ncbi:uncharacterized protein B0H18DRAFT_1190070 [Fomitopsis serialis]|uniref:uncharacterized protein n=1 Tax=Fomitopsis serialis TaxID=139415 RepID=UPI0020073C96|nr:uncharacterized protein B0H18DRAFT_1190070 [Neoantrodia serialis]KAH9921013.1 hypothetical protein B0H18DRAFT_1190070 [Neoantrodia serialis]
MFMSLPATTFLRRSLGVRHPFFADLSHSQAGAHSHSPDDSVLLPSHTSPPVSPRCKSATPALAAIIGSISLLGRMASGHFFDEKTRQAIDQAFSNVTLSNETLHSHANKLLGVYDDPSLAALNTPRWASRIAQVSAKVPIFTATRFFHSLYQTADDLGLTSGKRYVSAAICTCAGDAFCGTDPKAIAERLAELASAWAAFVLWPST